MQRPVTAGLGLPVGRVEFGQADRRVEPLRPAEQHPPKPRSEESTRPKGPGGDPTVGIGGWWG